MELFKNINWKITLFFIFSLFTFIIINAFFNIHFETNDDIAMALVSSGAYTGLPDNHLVFINIIYGTILNIFYSVIPNIEWYTVFFISIIITSISLLSHSIYHSKIDKKSKAGLILLSYAIFFELIIQLQFTKVAGISTITGIILLMKHNNSWNFNLFGVTLFVLGFLIRFEAALFCLIACFPLYYKIYTSNKNIKQNNNIKFMLFAISLVLFSKLIDFSYYNNNEWRTYKEYNRLRGKINDNPNVYGLNSNQLKNTSYSDLYLLLDFSSDPKSIKHENLKEIDIALNKKYSFGRKFSNAKQLLKYKKWLIAFLIISVLLIFNQKKYFSFATLLLIILLLAILSFSGIIKERVFFLAIISFTFSLQFYIKKKNDTKNHFYEFMFLFLIVTCSFFTIYRTSEKHQSNKRVLFNLKYEQNNLLKEYFKSNSSKKIFPYFGSYKLIYDPFNISKNHYKNRVFLCGWFTKIPLHKERFESFNQFTKDFSVLIDKHKLYNGGIRMIQQNIKEHYNLDVQAFSVSQSDNFNIVEFKVR